MNFLKKLLKCLVFPHIAMICLFVPAAAVLLIYAFLFLGAEHIGSYIIYAFSAYTLAVVCVRIPNIIKWVKTFKNENKYIVRLTGDARLRVNISLYGSFYFNAAYSLFQLGLAIYNSSIWFYALAAYYFLLALMRMYLLGYSRANRPGERIEKEYKRSLFCGVVMLFLNMALSVIVVYITALNREIVHHEIITIAMAAYTFTALTVAIVNMIRYRKYKSPVFSASKAISFASALVSMLTLENTMLATFGQGNESTFRFIITGISGGALIIAVLSLAVYMIAGSVRGLRRFNKT